MSKYNFIITLFFIAGLIGSGATKADARVAPQKFYSLHNAPHQKKAVTKNRFMPLVHKHGGRALKFKPSGRQAIKLQNHDSVPVVVPRSHVVVPRSHRVMNKNVTGNHARQLLSIYESVD